MKPGDKRIVDGNEEVLIEIHVDDGREASLVWVPVVSPEPDRTEKSTIKAMVSFDREGDFLVEDFPEDYKSPFESRSARSTEKMQQLPSRIPMGAVGALLFIIGALLMIAIMMAIFR